MATSRDQLEINLSIFLESPKDYLEYLWLKSHLSVLVLPNLHDKLVVLHLSIRYPQMSICYPNLPISYSISSLACLSVCVYVLYMCCSNLLITFFPYIRFTCGLKLSSNIVSRWGLNCFRGPLPGPELNKFETY